MRTTTTPCTSAQYLRNSSKCDSEFSGWHPPEEKQFDAWEADLPRGVFGPDEVGSVSAWAFDLSRGGVYYHLEGDCEISGNPGELQANFHREL